MVGIGALLVCSVATQAASAQDPPERQRTYQQERQRCLSGQSGQEQTSCLREAGAVRQQPQSVRDPVSAAQREANAVQRCDPLPDGERQSCIARMQGQGRVEGSAAAGGMLRELTEPTQ
jgi:hypothetical protein